MDNHVYYGWTWLTLVKYGCQWFSMADNGLLMLTILEDVDMVDHG